MQDIEEIKFQEYLKSVLNDKVYSDCRHFYTPTDGAIRPKLDLRVKRYQLAKTEAGQERETKEVLSVLDGLRKYQAEHVLLVGKPGSGKSTALEKLLLEEAERAKSNSQVGIPVLVRLRQYQTSVLELVRDFLMGHGFSEIDQLEQLLTEGRFLLLLDGVNELPSQSARTDLENFRSRYRKTTPMILTTRDLSLGGTVGVEHKLEMEPLTVPQMNEFVKGYLPNQHQQMLQQMGDRLQQFAETPLLLVMLCDVFDKYLKIPANLGEAFREFAQIYDSKLKESNVPTHENSQTVWPELLQRLAFIMMQGNSPTEFSLRITKQKATELIQQQFNKTYDQASLWLDDLLRYHLIQEFSKDQVEFRHQLIQEYYAAECLLKCLNGIDEDELKRKYLNYLKWTEPLMLMLGLENDPVKAVQLVKLGLEVDPLLGARLAGAANLEQQKETIKLIEELKISDFLKMELLGNTFSVLSVNGLKEAFQYVNIFTAQRAAQFLGEINTPKSLEIILDQIENLESFIAREGSFNDQHISLWKNLILALSKIDQNQAIKKISKIVIESLKLESSNICASFIGSNNIFNLWLQLDRECAITTVAPFFGSENSDETRRKSALLLSQAGISKITPSLVQYLYEHKNEVHGGMLDSLLETQTPEIISWLFKDIQSNSHSVRKKAVERLIKLNSPDSISGLCDLLNHSEWDIRWIAAIVLGSLGREEGINILKDGLNHQNNLIRNTAVTSLSKIENDQIHVLLITKLNDPVYFVRRTAAIALGKLGREEAVSELFNALRHYYPKSFDVNKRTSVELGETNYLIGGLSDEDLAKIGNSEAVSHWIHEIGYLPSYMEVAESILNVRSDAVISELIELQEHLNPHTQSSAAIILGLLENPRARQDLLLKALPFYKYEISQKVVQALSNLKSMNLITQDLLEKLLTMLHEDDYYALEHAALALDAIGDHTVLDRLSQNRLNSEEWFINFATLGIQNRCKFYNYQLTLADIDQRNALPATTNIPTSNQLITYDLRGATIGNLAHNVQGDQNSIQD
jgi:HEAT repeat protein